MRYSRTRVWVVDLVLRTAELGRRSKTLSGGDVDGRSHSPKWQRWIRYYFEGGIILESRNVQDEAGRRRTINTCTMVDMSFQVLNVSNKIIRRSLSRPKVFRRALLNNSRPHATAPSLFTFPQHSLWLLHLSLLRI